MLRGYRGIFAALAGLIVLSLSLAIGAYYGSLAAPEKRHYRSIGPNSGQSYPADSPRNGLADVPGIDTLTESAIAKPQPRNTDEREQRDLAAQESMAVFAYWMFWAVVLQTCLATGALIALLKDLRQNRTSAEQQLRAYVTYTKMYIRPETTGDKVQIEWTNRGQTPSFHTDAFTNWAVLDEPLPDDFEFPYKAASGEEGTLALGPQQTTFGTCDEPFPSEHLSKKVLSPKHVYVWGKAVYQDAFGIQRISTIDMKFDGASTEGGDAITRWRCLNRYNNMT